MSVFIIIVINKISSVLLRHIFNSGGIIYLHFIYRLHTPRATHKIRAALEALQLIKEFKTWWDLPPPFLF
jgi:hypothetical protein